MKPAETMSTPVISTAHLTKIVAEALTEQGDADPLENVPVYKW